MTTSSAQAKRSRRRGIAISVGVLVAAGAVVGVLVLTSRPMSSNPSHTASSVTLTETSSNHAGMGNHAGITESSPSPTGSGNLPGMSPEEHGSADVPGEHGSGDVPGTGPGEHGSGDVPGTSPGHRKAGDVVEDRPLAPVLGTFGVGTSAVLLSAGLVRRRDRARSRAKLAVRASRSAQK